MNLSIPDWLYYNHAVIPATAPHETPSLIPIEDGSIWRIDGKHPVMVRYTTDWDCGYDTGWWYVIKDSPFDISLLKTKRRYEITKAMRFFVVKEIKPVEYAEALSKVQEQAFSAYPPKYRPKFDKQAFMRTVETRDKQVAANKGKLFGAFDRQTSQLVGFSFVDVHSTWINFAAQRTCPNFEKNGLNAALVYEILETFKDKISKNFYICDGARNTKHETHFQNYLEKYFGFRKCYCKLKLVYSPSCRMLIAFLFPLRRIFTLLSSYIAPFHLVSSVLKMEEIARLSDEAVRARKEDNV